MNRRNRNNRYTKYDASYSMLSSSSYLYFGEKKKITQKNSIIGRLQMIVTPINSEHWKMARQYVRFYAVCVRVCMCACICVSLFTSRLIITTNIKTNDHHFKSILKKRGQHNQITLQHCFWFYRHHHHHPCDDSHCAHKYKQILPNTRFYIALTLNTVIMDGNQQIPAHNHNKYPSTKLFRVFAECIQDIIVRVLTLIETFVCNNNCIHIISSQWFAYRERERLNEKWY